MKYFWRAWYRFYAWITRYLPAGREPVILPVPCQLCGGNHTEQLCPNAKRLGF